jgi:hypothetical protein
MTFSAASAPFGFTPTANQDSTLLEQLGVLPGLKEILMVRQVHALEHATVWLLAETPHRFGLSEEADNPALGGMSTERGFYLYGAVETAALEQAAREALHRIVTGDWDLAVHPRCGTNLAVGMLLTAGLALGGQLVLPKDPLSQILGIGTAAATATYVAPELGKIVQRYITTAIPFNLSITGVERLEQQWGQPTHFVSVRWVDAS